MPPVRKLTCALLALMLGSIGGCSSVIKPVQPWEKGTLAKDEMIFDKDALDTLYAEHTYTSKEAAFGGAGVGGGGCGCN